MILILITVGRIDKAMVEQFHFGGGLFRQKAIDADDGEEAGTIQCSLASVLSLLLIHPRFS